MEQHIDKLSMGEKLTEGAAVSIMGFLIVFCVLLIIMIILSIFNAVAVHSAKKAAQQQPETPTVQPSVPAPAVQPAQTDDTQLIAVITAAIIAARAENHEGTDGLVVKSIRRVNSWNKEALSEQNISF